MNIFWWREFALEISKLIGVDPNNCVSIDIHIDARHPPKITIVKEYLEDGAVRELAAVFEMGDWRKERSKGES